MRAHFAIPFSRYTFAHFHTFTYVPIYYICTGTLYYMENGRKPLKNSVANNVVFDCNAVEVKGLRWN